MSDGSIGFFDILVFGPLEPCELHRVYPALTDDKDTGNAAQQTAARMVRLGSCTTSISLEDLTTWLNKRRIDHGFFGDLLSRCSKLSQLFDDLVGEQLQCVGHLDAEQSCRLSVDEELEFGRLQDR
jgi:hypothetical protein